MSSQDITHQYPGTSEEGSLQGAKYLRLVSSKHDLPDQSALSVIKRLSSSSGVWQVESASDMRARYNASRVPLLAPLPDIKERISIRPAHSSVPPLTLFVPSKKKKNGPLPALVYFHGGGWTLGGLETYEPLCRDLANRIGAIIVWVEYRLAPENPFPAAIEDAWAAVEWVQSNAEWMNIDPARIGVGGDSAGGNLAAVTAIAARDKYTHFNPAYQLLIYPCLDLTVSLPSHQELAEGYLLTRDIYAWYRSNYIGWGAVPSDWRLSPLFAGSLADLPPTIMLYAGFDPLRDEAAQYIRLLQRASVSVEAIYFPGMIHGFITMGGVIPEAASAIYRIASSVKRVLGDVERAS